MKSIGIILAVLCFSLCSAQWVTLSSLPNGASLGEVTSGYIGGKVYLVGQGNSNTYVYDPNANSWSTTTPRPYVGNHHAGITPGDGTWWLVGGLDAGQGMIQVFNTNSRQWSAFQINLPGLNAAGSISAVYANGNIYMCGGIAANTINNCGYYNIGTNSWTSIASMPFGVNHAAFATDGNNMYIFGGRQGINVPSVGVSDVQIYSFSGGTWSWSKTDSTIQKLPIGRGGMGNGVYVAPLNQIFILGGETPAGPPPTNGVYNNVHIFNIASRTWSSGTSMPVAKHGISPVFDGKYIYVLGGGVKVSQSGSGSAHRIQVYSPPPPPPPPPPSSSSVLSCPSSGQMNIMRCKNGLTCNVATDAKGWACCSTQGGRKACPVNKPVICPNNCGGDYCCAFTAALCASSGPALAMKTCP